MPASQSILSHACLECKRLKLKCDKQKPCGACVRRGCPDICPDGQLIAGKGTRFILSNTKDLHDEIDRLRERVKELEEALSTLQSQITPQPHPLLEESLRMVSEKLEPLEKDFKTEPVEEDESLIDTFGSLTIDHKGQTTWHGPHAGSEFLIPRTNMSAPPTLAPSQLPVELLLLSKQFPFKSIHDAEHAVRQQVRDRLPDKQVAHDASLTYFWRLTWSADRNAWGDFVEDVLNPVYEGNSATDEQVAVLYMVMAIYKLLDPVLPPSNDEAIQYYHLSRVSITLGEDLLQSKSLLAIQYLQLVGFFNLMVHDPNGPDKSWVAVSMAIRLAQMVCVSNLYRDNKQWDAYPKQAEKRRRIWWDLVSFETGSAFSLARPRSITSKHFDTRLPHDDEDEGKRPTFNRTRYKWMANGIGSILDDAFGVQAPSYGVTLELDKTIRNWPLDSVPPMDDLNAREPLDLTDRFMIMLMRSFSTTGLREIALLYLHRRYFVEALARRPKEPLRSKYALSVLAVHRSAVLLLQGIQRLDGVIGKLLPRIFFMWLHGLSAYVCLCAIVIKSPGCSLAPSCLVEINNTKDLFIRVTAYRISHAKPAIIKLHEQAHLAMSMYKEGKWPPKKTTEQQLACSEPGIDVMRFAGRSEFISPLESKDVSTPETSAGGSPPNQGHPLLFEYMKQFQPGSVYASEGAVIPPEQSLLPPIMPGSNEFGDLNGLYPPDMYSSIGIDNSLAFDPSVPQASTVDWMSQLSSQGMQPELFFGDGAALGMGFASMPASGDFLPNINSFPETSATSDFSWDQFLSGLVLQDA
ncbi:hypothetical protein M408DRAFT_65857 [Serendipita vermifera MAFF 305830]|uniref:Zn(2)-C6 fungal-type domain-containing protein n=1 Tax=Serendipita vermifera MAFF 305830 TaxID=933852 RepID=A0A0C2XQ24_SERVB|nr:hypothetical protein M408DRAFT_65857 [Serendipita vermifera MAFF 305830]